MGLPVNPSLHQPWLFPFLQLEDHIWLGKLMPCAQQKVKKWAGVGELWAGHEEHPRFSPNPQPLLSPGGTLKSRQEEATEAAKYVFFKIQQIKTNFFPQNQK